MAENRTKKRRVLGLALLVLAEAALAGIGTMAVMRPAIPQVLDERFPFLEDRRRRYQQQDRYQQWNQQQWNQQQWGQDPQYRQQQQPVESSRAPAPRRPEGTPGVNVVVFGDSMAEWLAYGLEEAFAETPEIGINRKPRANTGLIRVEQRGEAYDWPASARDILNAEKPDYVVMMLGTADRRGIREAIRQPARPPAGQKQTTDQAKQPQAAQAAQPGQPAQAAQPDAAAKKPADAEAAPDSAQAQPQEQPSIMAPEGGPSVGTVVREFRSEEWGELYGKRVEEMIGVLESAQRAGALGRPSVGARCACDRRDGLSQRHLSGASREDRHHLCRYLGRLRRRRRQLQQLRAGLRRPDAAPAGRRRRPFHARRCAQARALRRARTAPRDAGTL